MIQIPILAYHSVAEASSPQFQRWVIHPTLFQKHMQFLSEQGYTPITVSQLVVASQADKMDLLPKRPIVLTFDDAFQDFYTQALPILQTYNFTATLYVPTKYVGSTSLWLQKEQEADRLLMTWEQIKTLSDFGIECGSHSHSHPQLDILTKDEARNELTVSRKILEDQLGKAVSSFAYPFGYHDRTTRQLVIEAGYSSACAVKYTLSSPQSDSFTLPRVIIENISTNELEQFLNGKNLLWPPYEQLRSFVWRFVRRMRSE